MSGRRRAQHHNSSNSPSAAAANYYNPIAMINNEINTEECRQLLMKVDTMREILQMEKIPLPQIVVVGDQSVDSIVLCFKSTSKSFV